MQFIDPKNTLFVTETMSNAYIQSTNALYRAYIQSDGDFMIYKKDSNGFFNDLKWAANTAGNPNAILEMQSGGNLVVKATNGTVVWSTFNTYANSYLIMQDNGQLVIYDANNYPRWAVPTQCKYFSRPTPSL